MVAGRTGPPIASTPLGCDPDHVAGVRESGCYLAAMSVDELSSASIGQLRRLSFANGRDAEAELIDVDDDALVALQIDDSYRYDGFFWAPRGAIVSATALQHPDRLARWLASSRKPVPPDPEAARASRTIHRVVDSEQLVAIHNDEEHRFMVGWLRSVPGSVVLDEVLADGSRRLGTRLRFADIQKLEWGTRYLEAVRLIHELADEASLLAPYVEATRSAEITRLLKDARQSGALVHVVRAGEPGWYTGGVVGLGRDVVVLRELDEDSLEIDGYQAFRRDCISKVALDQKDVARKRVLRARGQSLEAERVWPSSFAGLLSALTRQDRESAELVAVHDHDPDACFVGHLFESSRAGDTKMHYVAPYGIDEDTYSLSTQSIEVVEWGSRYLAAIEGMRRL
jgi:hypothetical protein